VSRAVSPLKIVAALAALVVTAAIVLYLVPSNDYLLLPDAAHPVAPLVRVQGGHDPKGPGGVYFVDVFERRASMFEALFPSIHKGATLVPARLIVPPGVSDKAARQADLREMSISQRVAAAVALRQLGYHVVARPSGVVVAAIDAGSHAVGKLEPADVIVAVDGASTPKPGDSATLAIRRGDERHVVRVRTSADPSDEHRAIVGFAPEQAAEILLPVKVQIDAGNVGGPSAGLAFALEVMEELGRNVDHGHTVAATGQINLDGTVSPIGGARQKIFGVRAAGVDVFLVPAGDNAAIARRYAGGVRVIAVKTFPQALRALATLPRKP